MIVIGIDPGQKGAVARLDTENGLACVESLPILSDRTLNAAAFQELIRGANLIVLEKVGGDPAWGACPAFAFGFICGEISNALKLSGIPTETPTPQRWKKSILQGTKKDKDAAVGYAARRFPAVNLVPPGCRKPSHDRAEALCLAEFGRRLLCGGEAPCI